MNRVHMGIDHEEHRDITRDNCARVVIGEKTRMMAYADQCGAWKWNFSAPKVLMTVSKMPNCSAVSVPIITQRAPKPCVQSFTTPVSLVMFIIRCGIEPSPP